MPPLLPAFLAQGLALQHGLLHLGQQFFLLLCLVLLRDAVLVLAAAVVHHVAQTLEQWQADIESEIFTQVVLELPMEGIVTGGTQTAEIGTGHAGRERHRREEVAQRLPPRMQLAPHVQAAQLRRGVVQAGVGIRPDNFLADGQAGGIQGGHAVRHAAGSKGQRIVRREVHLPFQLQQGVLPQAFRMRQVIIVLRVLRLHQHHVGPALQSQFTLAAHLPEPGAALLQLLAGIDAQLPVIDRLGKRIHDVQGGAVL